MGTPRILIALHLSALLAIVACSPEASSAPQGVVRVVGSWEGPEAAAFEAVVAPFVAQTGVRVDYIATRDPLAQLEADTGAGDTPDVLALPSPALLARLARDGRLVELGDVLDMATYKRETAPAFLSLGTVDGQLFGAAYKGAVKGLLWFDPAVYIGREQRTWAELLHAAALSTRRTLESGGPEVVPWCAALGSAESSGWPGTDWVEDLLLRQSGPETYDAWVSGELPWTSPDVEWAFRSYGLVVDAAGEPASIVADHFSAAAEHLLGEPPRCLFLHQGSFMPEFLDAVGGDYDFMPFPVIDPSFAGALIGGGDLLALAADTAGGRALIRYLVSAEAQQLLVSHGGAVSGNLSVGDYPDPLMQRMARMLADASIFRFDASDSMSPEVEAAFRQAVLDYTLEPQRLDAILAQVENVRLPSEARG